MLPLPSGMHLNVYMYPCSRSQSLFKVDHFMARVEICLSLDKKFYQPLWS
eukprot:c43664_g1_i1 orf=21-170(+)